MIFVAYKKVSGTREELEADVRRVFHSLHNKDYLDEISARKNSTSVCESYTALLLLSRLLRELELDAGQFVLDRKKTGKPYFKCSELEFSISHSKGMVAVALSDSGAVGIDIEATKMTNDRAAKLFERYFDEDTSHMASSDSFLQLWVRTEAYVKLCGTTLADGIQKKIPDDINFYNFVIDGFPISIAFIGDNTVNIIDI